ncbi:MAG: DUF4238 domain-containing protein [Lachnospiraceae bacterium]|nr:DUF4238 domain-containing protein [Lachnospiraceae bacterium]
MPKAENITRKQHYIPQVYLRGFSLEYIDKNNEIPLSRYMIYCHDLTKETQLYKSVPIKSICYKNDLYEVTGHDGEIVLPNRLEKFFSVLEKMFSEYRNKLERKVFITENYKTNYFLTQEEKSFWITYILIQILRMPQILELAEQVSLETLGEELTNKQAQNIARLFCLPFFREMTEGNVETKVFSTMFEPMKSMAFGIGVDVQGRIITSDKAVFVYSKEFPCEEYEKIIFPISSQICLFMFGNQDKKMQRKNFLFPIDEGCREEIVKSMSASAFEKVYSNHIFDKKERKYIKEIMKDREEIKERRHYSNRGK